MEIINQLQQQLDGSVQPQMPLAPLTTFKVGGVAEYGYVAETVDQLTAAYVAGQRLGLSVTILGRGANVLISDAGVSGFVIINRTKQFEIQSNGLCRCDSGCDTAMVLQAAEQAGWIGLECLLKVPGTVGGAIYMNAGDTGKQRFIGQLVESVTRSNSSGQRQEMSQLACHFGYRESLFQRTNDLIISVTLRLVAADVATIESARRDILARKSHHPSGSSCGSTFRNPPGEAAGRLIDNVGLKGHTIGGASVSTQHANFIMNDGTATATDIAELIYLMRQTVHQQTGIKLVEEVRYIGDWHHD